jgi:hypothetical protein
MGKFIYDEEDDYIINRPENDNRTSIKNIKQKRREKERNIKNNLRANNERVQRKERKRNKSLY